MKEEEMIMPAVLDTPINFESFTTDGWYR